MSAGSKVSVVMLWRVMVTVCGVHRAGLMPVMPKMRKMFNDSE